MGTAFVGLLLDYRSMLYGGGFSIFAGAFVITPAPAGNERPARPVLNCAPKELHKQRAVPASS